MAILFENKFITSVLNGKISIAELDNSNFEPRWLKNHGSLYEWLHNYIRSNNRMPELDLVTERYPDYSYTETAESPNEILAALNRGSIRERIYKDIQQAAKLLQDQADPEQVVTQLKSKLLKFDLKLDTELDVHDLTSDNFLAGAQDYIERRKAFETKGTVGIPSGLGPEFDAFIGGGFYKGLLYGPIGFTGVGKSWIAQMHGKAAMDVGISPMYFALEGQAALEYYRFMTIVTELSNASIMGGTVDLNEFDQRRQQIREYSNRTGAKFWLATFGQRNKYTPELIHKQILRYKPGIVIVDYLQMLQTTEPGIKQWEELLIVSRDLKIISMAEQIPIVAVMQTDMSAANSDVITNANIGLSKGTSRDFDYTWGINRVKGMNNILKVNGAGKARFSKESEFAALYRANFDNGKVKFEQHVNDDTNGTSF